MGLSDDMKRKAREEWQKKNLAKGLENKPGASSSGKPRPAISEEQKKKARELAKKNIEAREEKERLAEEKARLERQSREESQIGKRGLTDKQKAQAIQVEQQLTKAEVLYEKAVAKYLRPDISEALLLLRSALSLHPSNPKYHYNIAYIYSVKGDYEICLNHYKSFLRYAPATDPDIENVKSRVIYYEKLIREQLEAKRLGL